VTEQTDDRHDCKYPLQVLGWNRQDCENRIRAEGLPVPVKSACFYCCASRPDEIDSLEPALLRRIVAIEARAKPRLRNVDGLWRSPVKGMRGAVPRPGNMTTYIRDKGLLTAHEIAEIQSAMPTIQSRPAADGGPEGSDDERAAWAAAMDTLGDNRMAAPRVPAPYQRKNGG
jgi:hypothetical protein